MRILMIEDEKEIADGTKKILEQVGYTVDTVYDGINGLDCIFSGIYDLILLDVMLPGLDGFEILKMTRSENINIPIIMLTAKSMVDDKIFGLNKGADDYITKPFDAGELIARVGARLRVSYGSENNNYTVNDICLDKSTYKLIKNEKSVKLSKIEYGLMEYLMLNKSQILTKDMLVGKVWGYDGEPDYNSLEVYISFLRKKLKFLGAETNIVTKKGIGYLLEETLQQ